VVVKIICRSSITFRWKGMNGCYYPGVWRIWTEQAWTVRVKGKSISDRCKVHGQKQVEQATRMMEVAFGGAETEKISTQLGDGRSGHWRPRDRLRLCKGKGMRAPQTRFRQT